MLQEIKKKEVELERNWVLLMYKGQQVERPRSLVSVSSAGEDNKRMEVV